MMSFCIGLLKEQKTQCVMIGTAFSLVNSVLKYGLGIMIQKSSNLIGNDRT